MEKKFILILCMFISIYSYSQGGYLSNNDEIEYILDRAEIRYADDSDNFYTHIKPFPRDLSAAFSDKLSQIELTKKDSFLVQYTRTDLKDKLVAPYKDSARTIWNLFFKEKGQFLAVNKKDFYLKLNPSFDISIGKELDVSPVTYNAFRGLELAGEAFKTLNFYLHLTENQYRPFSYVTYYGQGFYGQNKFNFNPYYNYWKSSQLGNFDFTNSIGYVDFSPNKYLSFTLGHDRNFYGYGYRSLLLGRTHAPYFQFKTNLTVWKLHYQFMVTEFTGQYIRGGDRLLPKKYGAFHLLTFKPSKHIDLGFYESVIFHRSNGFELNYLNPIIYYHSIEHALGSPDNSTIGFQMKANIAKHVQIYNQILIDDMQVKEFFKGSGWWGNKYGGQLGVKWIDIANVSTLDFQGEFNIVRPYTYAHSSDTTLVDNFSHYNQPLAHPLGANFYEVIASLSYRPFSRWKLHTWFTYSVRGSDAGYSDSTFYGNDIFANIRGNELPSQYGNTITQGNRSNLLFLRFSSQYMLTHNLFIDVDAYFRKTVNENEISIEPNPKAIGFSAGIRYNFIKRHYMF